MKREEGKPAFAGTAGRSGANDGRVSEALPRSGGSSVGGAEGGRLWWIVALALLVGCAGYWMGSGRDERERARLAKEWAEVKQLREEAKRQQRAARELTAQETKHRQQTARNAAAGKTWTNSIGMKFVLIPPGSFEMGCMSEVENCSSHEKPRHAVRISRPFYLGKYEVTQTQWMGVMGRKNNPSRFKGRNRPVDNVSWDDAQAFIKELNAKEGHNRYRLPTEAEWEYAARAGIAAVYSFGNDPGQLRNFAWYGYNSGAKTHPVGKKRPNAWGLFDMHGNVNEWVQDWAGKYSAGTAMDPQGPVAGEKRVLRGGSWNFDAWNCRTAKRQETTPGSRYTNHGFRLALDSWD